MLRTLTLALMLTLCGAASAQRLYKCESGGKKSYSNSPCTKGKMTEMRVKNTSNTVVRRSPPATQLRKSVVTRVEKQATEREEAARRLQAATNADAERARRCIALRLQHDRAVAEADEAPRRMREGLQATARNQRAAMKVECPG